jgi:hypothetical protein
MSRFESVSSLTLAAVLLLAGCTEQASRTPTDMQVEPLCFSRSAQPDSSAVVTTAEDVLAKMHFTIEKADKDAGVIRTRPLVGAQFFELWRKDSVGGFNRAEANLHSLRRTVELRIRETDRNLCIDCLALTQRLTVPQQDIISSARTREAFSRSTSLLRKMEVEPEQGGKVGWIDLGNDVPLAEEILKRIQERLEPAK